MGDSITISQITLRDKPFLKFDFPKHLDIKTAQDAIERWKNELSKLPLNEKVDLLFNCMDMSGFETDARKLWQSTLREQKPQTGQIWIVCENLFILGAAKTMGILAGYKIKVTRSIDKVGES